MPHISKGRPTHPTPTSVRVSLHACVTADSGPWDSAQLAEKGLSLNNRPTRIYGISTCHFLGNSKIVVVVFARLTLCSSGMGEAIRLARRLDRRER